MKTDDRGTPLKRFTSKYKIQGDCWIWTASTSGKGYGYFYSGPGRSSRAHRFAYEELVGEIPEGMQIDHLCRQRLCVNPGHLEVVTNSENQRRGENGILKTACANGHPWTAVNVYHRPSGAAYCAICHRERARRYRALRSEGK
jgi:hypothetical protein